ncbi:MAG: zinc ribbon domain-containing protein [Dehalococcoidia bacterium]
MNCPNCKAYNPSNANYCAQCGTALETPEDEARDRQERDPAQPGNQYRPFATPGELPATGQLTPRTLSQLITETFTIYRNSFVVFWRIALVAQIPLFIGNFIANENIVLSLSLATLFTGLLANGATTYAVTQYYLKRTATASTSYAAALNNSMSLLGAFVVFVVAMVPAALLSLILIGLPLLTFIILAWFFYVQAIMVEEKGAMAALSRSWELVRWSWQRVLGIGVVFLLILFSAGMAVSIPGALLGLANDTLGSLLITTGTVLVTPIGYVGAAVVYFDLRVRKEGYNLEMLSSEAE